MVMYIIMRRDRFSVTPCAFIHTTHKVFLNNFNVRQPPRAEKCSAIQTMMSGRPGILYSGDSDGAVRVWETGDRKCVLLRSYRVFKVHAGGLFVDFCFFMSSQPCAVV